MLNIYLARHGQDQDNVRGILNGHRDEPLTELGESQAQELAQKIKSAGIKFNKIYSSPLIRTSETAKIIASALLIEAPELMPLLIERDFGIMTGKPIAEIESLCAPDILKTDTITYVLSPEGAETFPQLMIRAHAILEKIKTNHQDGDILLVTSGDIGKMIYASYYNLYWKDVLTMFHFGNSELLLLANNSPASNTHIFKTEQSNH
jgi:probable phosphoglycerate mutase